MTSTARKLLPCLILAVTGAAGLYTWKSNRLPPAHVASEPSSVVRHWRETPQRPAPDRLAFVADSGEPLQARIDQLRSSLAEECGEREIRTLYQLLESGPPKGEKPEHWYVIANGIMTHLRAHETDPERYSGNLLHLLDSPGQPLVLRDIAVQHLVSWLDSHPLQDTDSLLPPPSQEIVSQVLLAMVIATADRDLESSSIPETTLKMLVDRSRSPVGRDCSQAIVALKPWLTEALGNGSTVENSVRVSAVQAAGVLLPEEFRPVIRKIAYSENGQSPLRLPAIAALGRCGESEDIEMLQQLIATQPDLSYAAHDASIALVERLEQPTTAVSDR